MPRPNAARRSTTLPFMSLAALLALVAGLATSPPTADAQSQPPAGYDKLRMTGAGNASVTTGGLVTVQLDPQTIEPGFDPGELILYIDHIPLTGTKPVTGGVKRSTLHYRLDRTAANRDAWLTLFRRHDFGPDSVPIGVGLVPFGEIPTRSGALVKVHLTVVFGWTLVVGAIIAGLIALFMILWGGDLLRERPRPPPSTAGARIAQGRTADPPRVPARNGVPLPFSLGRVQMAFWFTLVAGAYVFIALATRDHNGILNDTTLTLMGIGVGTALGSAAIQMQKREYALRKLAMIEPELEEAEAMLQQAGAAAPTARVQRLRVQVEDLWVLMGKSGWKGFWKDLIHDATGPSFHRFQIVVWTLLLGVVFIRYVMWYVAMPTFDTTMLALMGISGGTYLGFKIQERPA